MRNWLVGDKVGNGVGDVEGDADGGSVGELDGLAEGRAEGDALGDADGAADGEVDGDTEGDVDGASVEHAPFIPLHIPSKHEHNASAPWQMRSKLQSAVVQHAACVRLHAGHWLPPQSTSVS